MFKVPINLNKAAEFLQFPAKHRLAGAQTMLGFMYLNEEGAPKDPAAFFRLEQAAAEHKFPAAEYNLGLSYCNDYGVPPGTDISTRMQSCADWLRSAQADPVFLGQRVRSAI